MRFCQLCQFVCGTLPQAKRVVSVVSVHRQGVFKPSGGWRGFHGMLDHLEENTRGTRLPQLTQPLGKIYEIDEPAAEVRLDPRAQNILDVQRWTAEWITRKEISPGSSSSMSTGTNWDCLARTLGASRREEYGAVVGCHLTRQRGKRRRSSPFMCVAFAQAMPSFGRTGEVIIRKRWIYTPFKEVRDGTPEEVIAKFEACISDFIRLSPRWALVLNHRNTLRFILRKTPTASIFMNTTDEANDRNTVPVETQQLFAADDTLNRELDALRQRRYRHYEPDLEYVQAAFEKLYRSDPQH